MVVAIATPWLTFGITPGTIVRSCRSGWQCEGKRSAATRFAERPDAAPVGIDDCLRDIQPESEATAVGVSSLLEAVENSLQVRRLNAPAGVAHRHPAAALVALYADGDRPADRGVLNGISQQVGEHLHNALVIETCVHLRGGCVDLQRQACAVRECAEGRGRFLHDLYRILAPRRQAEAPL